MPTQMHLHSYQLDHHGHLQATLTHVISGHIKWSVPRTSPTNSSAGTRTGAHPNTNTSLVYTGSMAAAEYASAAGVNCQVFKQSQYVSLSICPVAPSQLTVHTGDFSAMAKGLRSSLS